MSKRKSRKSSSLLGIFLLTALILILITAYLYRRNPEFKAKADKFSAEAQEKSEKALADIEGRIGEITKNFNDFTKSEENAPTEQEQSKSAEESQKSESEKSPSSEKQKSPAKNSAPKKLVALPVGLEKPICAGIHGSGDHQIREFEHYSICYRESYEQAEWSAYCLTEEELAKNALTELRKEMIRQFAAMNANLDELNKLLDNAQKTDAVTIDMLQSLSDGVSEFFSLFDDKYEDFCQDMENIRPMKKE